MVHVSPEETSLAEQTGYVVVRETGMSGLILNKQDACAPSDQTRLRIFDLYLKEAAYYLRLRVHGRQVRSSCLIPEVRRVLTPWVTFSFKKFYCIVVGPLIAKQLFVSISFLFHLIRYCLGQLVISL